MARNWYPTVAVALLVVLAGCAGGIGTPTTQPTDGNGPAGGDSATVNFYISDERNDIDDFEHLNVTVTEVGFERADSGESEDEEKNETTTTAGATTAAPASNGTTAVATDTSTAENATTEMDDAPTTADEEDPGEESGEEGRVTVDIPDTTVDLTELRGANASLLANVTVPNGTYETVFIEVGAVNGTLKTGDGTAVKLPSGRLHLEEGFTARSGDSVDFVYDVTAIKAGQSGTYILKPVVSESGTDVPIETPGENRGSEDRGDSEREDRGENRGEDRGEPGPAEQESALTLSIDGNVTAGENVTVTVTRNGSPVENATVDVDDGVERTTAAEGTLVVTVPDDDEFEVEAEAGDDEAELEVELDAESEDDDRGDPPAEAGDRGNGNGQR
jgi:hypothetical protein